MTDVARRPTRRFPGFPDRMELVPVPGAMFGTLLREIDDLAELKTLLHVLRLLHAQPRAPRFVQRAALLADAGLLEALGSLDGRADEATVADALDRAVGARHAAGDSRRRRLDRGRVLPAEHPRERADRPAGAGRRADARRAWPGARAARAGPIWRPPDHLRAVRAEHRTADAAAGRGAARGGRDLSGGLDRGCVPRGRGPEQAQLALRPAHPRKLGEPRKGDEWNDLATP